MENRTNKYEIEQYCVACGARITYNDCTLSSVLWIKGIPRTPKADQLMICNTCSSDPNMLKQAIDAQK